MMWPATTGSVSAVIVFVAGASLIERRRILSRRAQLRSLLFK